MAAGTIGQPLAHTAPLMLLTALGSWHWCPHFATEDTIWGACLGSGDQGVLGPEPQGPTGPQPPLHTCPCLGWPPPTSRSFTGARSSPGYKFPREAGFILRCAGKAGDPSRQRSVSPGTCVVFSPGGELRQELDVKLCLHLLPLPWQLPSLPCLPSFTTLIIV